MHISRLLRKILNRLRLNLIGTGAERGTGDLDGALSGRTEIPRSVAVSQPAAGRTGNSRGRSRAVTLSTNAAASINHDTTNGVFRNSR
jgi:hypothetical protein